MKKNIIITLSAFFTLSVATPTLAADDALLARIAQLEAQVQQLITLVQTNNANTTNQQAQIDEVANQVESTAENDSKTTISGYGELHYNNRDDGDDEIDFHRFVLEFGHEFNDTTRFFSELELEHTIAGEGQVGEIELEQAYIEHDFNDNISGRAGVVLIPVGILNETHEPTTFYGVERNRVENVIVPATWWGGGLGITAHTDNGFSYDVVVHEGLNVPTSGNNAFRIRSGRQKTGEAVANDLAATGRIKYTGVAGLELAATYQYQQDITQGLGTDTASANLVELHTTYNNGPLSLRALYAQWNIGGNDAKVSTSSHGDKQDGYYLEAGYRILSDLGVFARYSEWDTGGLNDTKSQRNDYGVNYWLNEDVVFKADVQNESGASNADGFNLGLGYTF